MKIEIADGRPPFGDVGFSAEDLGHVGAETSAQQAVHDGLVHKGASSLRWMLAKDLV